MPEPCQWALPFAGQVVHQGDQSHGVLGDHPEVLHGLSLGVVALFMQGICGVERLVPASVIVFSAEEAHPGGIIVLVIAGPFREEGMVITFANGFGHGSNCPVVDGIFETFGDKFPGRVGSYPSLLYINLFPD